MEMIDGLSQGFSVILGWENLYLCFLGSLIGTLIGLLPGIGPLGAISLLLPITFQLPPVGAIAMLVSIFYGAMYGGSTTAILINIPGEAASVVTTLDGHKMALSGRAGPALGMAALGSFIAGILSLIALSFFSPMLIEAALRFGPPENFSIIILSLVATIFMVHGSLTRAVQMIALGLLVAVVGIDVVDGQERFTLGLLDLTSGFDLAAVVIGLFGVSEILLNMEDMVRGQAIQTKLNQLWPTFRDWLASWLPILRGTVIGFIFGILPGGGPVTAAFVSYAAEKRLSHRPDRFGNGAIEGVAGPESANNAAVGGSMIPLLSLGLPSNAVTALLLGAFIIQGVQPGPLLMSQNPELFWGVIAAMFVGNVVLLILNLPLIGLWVQLLRVPYAILFPIVLLLGVVGAYSSNSNMFDVWVMIGFGVLGYILKKAHYELSPLVLAIVLGPLLEQSLRQSLIMSHEGPMIFASRPISAAMLMAAAVLLVLLVAKKTKKGAYAS
ncbi:tripartite tricarboxylate transporter permease [Rhodoligotrophos ferricapiens]|uniref:tripartite tricarboxylate transporter permease n=1 Tax=Rhodoligotrophos ferricapiens TaxID=3069264 RepID=UPI00315C4BEC